MTDIFLDIFYRFSKPRVPSFKLVFVPIALRKDLHFRKIKPDDAHVLWSIRQKYIGDMKKKYLDLVGTLDRDVKMIVFGEMTYPFTGNSDEDEDFKQNLIKLARKKKVYIVAGSYHDVSKTLGYYYNSCMIFTPDRKDPIIQIKNSRARQEGELTDTPDDKSIQIICTPFGNFAVIICLDLASADFWIKISERNLSPKKYPRLHFVIAPSYDPKFRLGAISRDHSKPLQIPVGFVNACNDKWGKREEPFFQDGRGEQVKPLKKKPYYLFHITSSDLKPPKAFVDMS